MLDLEGMAHHFAAHITKDSSIDAVQKAKIEYGLALILGVTIELVLTAGVSVLFGAATYTLVMMLAALVLRVFTGGVHCSSFRRCLVFTMLFFVGLSLITKTIAIHTSFSSVIERVIFPALIGIAFQAFMLT